jgi:uncharacterized protein YsxB (DUF464 family)
VSKLLSNLIEGVVSCRRNGIRGVGHSWRLPRGSSLVCSAVKALIVAVTRLSVLDARLVP